MMKKGFTLVELLIVIGLLGAIALIVIAAINPIEQANRARDTRLKADSGQIVSAVERYFVGVGEFPWQTSGAAEDNESEFGFVSATNVGVGICGNNCNTNGSLLTSEELKDEFLRRDFIKNGDQLGKSIYVGKGFGTTATVYACFVPLSKSVRQKAVDDQVVYTIDTTDGSRTPATSGDCADPTKDWLKSTAGASCFVCVPE